VAYHGFPRGYLPSRLAPSKRDRDDSEIMYSESSGRGLWERLQDLEGKRAKKRRGKRRSAGRRI